MGYGSMGSLYLGVSGLQTSQTALNVTAHNMANVDTPGYVRQNIDFASYLGCGELETKLAQKMGPCPVFPDYEQEEINPANELTEMQNNALLYSMASRRMSNIITQMKTVINVGK